MSKSLLKPSTRRLIRKHRATKRRRILGSKGGYGRSLMAALLIKNRHRGFVG